MRNIGILVNTNKDDNLQITQRLYEALTQEGFTPVLFGAVAEKLGYPAISRNVFLKRCDCIFVLGGDGTVLGAVPEAAKAGIPLMGINLGKLGFLTEIEVNEIAYAAKKLAAKEYQLQKRMMLQCNVAGKELYALNEITVQRASYERIINVKISTKNCVVDQFFADGVIAATPTGSTAYSLSAGGPILTPDIAAILLTPICAHTLRSRPIVFPDTEILNISVKSAADISISYDGTELLIKEPAAEIIIQKAPFEASFITLKEKNFYKLLNTKLYEWSTAREENL